MIALRDLFELVDGCACGVEFFLRREQPEPVLRSDRVPELPNPELPGSRSSALKKMLEGK